MAERACPWCTKRKPLVLVAVVFGVRHYACRGCSRAAIHRAEAARYAEELSTRGQVAVLGFRTSWFGPGVTVLVHPDHEPRADALCEAVEGVFNPWKRELLRSKNSPRAFVDSDTARDRLTDRTPELQRLATAGAGDAGSSPAAKVAPGTPGVTGGAIPPAGAEHAKATEGEEAGAKAAYEHASRAGADPDVPPPDWDNLGNSWRAFLVEFHRAARAPLATEAERSRATVRRLYEMSERADKELAEAKANYARIVQKWSDEVDDHSRTKRDLAELRKELRDWEARCSSLKDDAETALGELAAIRSALCELADVEVDTGETTLEIVGLVRNDREYSRVRSEALTAVARAAVRADLRHTVIPKTVQSEYGMGFYSLDELLTAIDALPPAIRDELRGQGREG